MPNHIGSSSSCLLSPSIVTPPARDKPSSASSCDRRRSFPVSTSRAAPKGSTDQDRQSGSAGSPFDVDTARVLGAACGYRVRGLAEHLGVSPRHLRRLFTRQLGCPPERWLREERLRVAGQLLLTTGGVKQVAFALAFRNESQFCRDFRAHFDCTPTEWTERGRAALV